MLAIGYYKEKLYFSVVSFSGGLPSYTAIAKYAMITI